MICQGARVVILLTTYARDHREAWPYVDSLIELMRFSAADRNDMVDEAAVAAPSERVLEELARLGAMLQSALCVQTYGDRQNQLCDANDAVVAAAAFVRSLDPVVISAAANAEVSTCVETSASMPPVDPTPSADVCNCVECSFHIVIAEGSSTMREFMFTSLLWAFGTRTQDDQSLSPTIVHMEPNGSEYVEFAVHGYINIEGRRVESIDAFIWRFIDNLRGFYLHCDIMRRTRPQCGDVFKHFKTAVRRYDGNQFNEEFQSYCNLNTALELAGLFSDMCSRSDDRSAAYGEARRYGFVPRNQEQCTCASCVSVC